VIDKLKAYLAKFLNTTEDVYNKPRIVEMYPIAEEEMPMAAEPLLPPEKD
jgi:hypothetical protein